VAADAPAPYDRYDIGGLARFLRLDTRLLARDGRSTSAMRSRAHPIPGRQ
jgi:hypothetical protein